MNFKRADFFHIVSKGEMCITSYDQFDVESFIIYWMRASSEFTSADLVLFHPFTNDMKRYDPKQCVDKLNHIIEVVQHKWPQSKIIIPLATPRADEFHHHINGQILNALLEQHLHEN